MFIDCRGEECPIPVIKAKKALDGLPWGGKVEVCVDILEAVENIGKMAAGRGYPYTVAEQGEEYIITIKKPLTNETGAAEITQAEHIISAEPQPSGVVVVVSSDKMGEGDEELGRSLLKAFFAALAEADTTPAAIIFYNSGVRIPTGASPTGASPLLTDLALLKEAGADILSCGACLKYYGLTEEVKIGRISNMFEIVSLMMANRVIKP
jgi:selenium metabolism protein YedF